MALLELPLVAWAQHHGLYQEAELLTNFTGNPKGVTFSNPLYEEDVSFRSLRRWELLGLTRREACWFRRAESAVLLGSLMGLERRASNRPAGVRTLSLVALGACLFTIASTYAFEDGSQLWDASRISAALPSGVGFLGGALIFKHTPGGAGGNPELIGLTTACGVWVACSVGVLCGGGLIPMACFGAAAMVTICRFGPRRPGGIDEHQDEEDEDGPEESEVKTKLSSQVIPEEKANTTEELSGSFKPERKQSTESRKRSPSMVISNAE